MPGDRAQQEGCKTESCEVCDVDTDDNIASHVTLKTLTLHLLDRGKLQAKKERLNNRKYTLMSHRRRLSTFSECSRF